MYKHMSMLSLCVYDDLYGLKSNQISIHNHTTQACIGNSFTHSLDLLAQTIKNSSSAMSQMLNAISPKFRVVHNNHVELKAPSHVPCPICCDQFLRCPEHDGRNPGFAKFKDRMRLLSQGSILLNDFATKKIHCAICLSTQRSKVPFYGH